MERRKAEVGRFARNAEAAGRQAWNNATQTGQDVLARTQSELAALGQQRLQQTGDTAAPQKPSGPAAGSRLDQSSAAKAIGGSAAQIAGTVVGVGQGAWDSVKGLGQGLLFATRLLDPDDAETNGADESAWGQVFNAGKGAIDYVKNGVANPDSVANDVQNLGRRLYVETAPSATPEADTLSGELSRNFNLGRNQGELGWDVGSLLFGGAASKALRGLGSTAEAGSAAKFVAQGFSPSQADYLAAPYEGMGHHFVPRNALKPVQLPKTLSDSPFNVLKPTGMSRGDFYELHFGVDPGFNSANLPRNVGGGTWNGKVLGVHEYGPWASVWHGSPAPLNAAAGAAGMAGLANYDPSGDGEP